MKTPLFVALATAALAVLTLSWGCGNVRLMHNGENLAEVRPASGDAFAVVRRGAYPPWRGAVTIYRSRDEIKDLRYEKLGLVTARSPHTHETDRAEMIIELQRQAADLGANAILLLEQDNEKDRAVGRLRAEALRVIDPVSL